MLTRLGRQSEVGGWCRTTFGDEAMSVQNRAIRMLEEAIEAYQAAGASREMAHKLVDFVFERPVGDLGQELGGLGVTLLALAEAAGDDADERERAELDRVLGLPAEHWGPRDAVKRAAGFIAPEEGD